MDTAKAHQMSIAKKTLKMSVSGAAIMGGMTYAEAYQIVFRTDLVQRLNALVAEYGDKAALEFDDGGVCWELGRYGYTPAGLLVQIQA